MRFIANNCHLNATTAWNGPNKTVQACPELVEGPCPESFVYAQGEPCRAQRVVAFPAIAYSVCRKRLFSLALEKTYSGLHVLLPLPPGEGRGEGM